MFKFGRSGFRIFVLVFVSRDFELGRNIGCEESTVSPVRGRFVLNVASVISQRLNGSQRGLLRYYPR